VFSTLWCVARPQPCEIVQVNIGPPATLPSKWTPIRANYQAAGIGGKPVKLNGFSDHVPMTAKGTEVD
jgi:hypothetical protein